jgi:DNA gyrase subunit A
VKTLNVTEKNGALKTLTVVTDDNDIIVVSDRGVVMRTDASKIAQTNRATQGVTIIKLKNDQKVSTVAIVPHQEDEEEETLNQDTFVQETLDVDTQETTPVVQELEADLEDVEETEETETNDQLFKD